MEEYIAKWHRELGIFCRIKPLILIEGNVLDVYRYPVEGSAPKGSILRLPEYLHYYFEDLGYQTVAFLTVCRAFIILAIKNISGPLQSLFRRKLKGIAFEAILKEKQIRRRPLSEQRSAKTNGLLRLS